ncbi:MAG: folylpolyglutamate synthase/dihydrofolate synthase family protein [Rikenellaceae bacterium]
MNYSQTLEYLFTSMPSFQEVGSDAYKPGLERITEFCKELGNPQRNFYTIHVAGTNGKGSLSHILASVLREAGYCVGLYTSPHLEDFRERVRIDGVKIPKQRVINFVSRNRARMEQLQLSFFEMTTALAFDYFAHNNVEIAIIETGLGGRLDATNIIVPILSVITNIGLEHQSYLGDTIEKIAAEKGGIIKKSIPVVVGERDDRYNSIFTSRAHELNSPIIFAQERFSCLQQSATADGQRITIERHLDRYIFQLDIDLAGSYQRENLITAIAAADYLHRHTPLSISRRAFVEGVAHTAATTSLKGRWQKIAEAPLTICDTGHNSHSLKLVAQQIKQSNFEKLYCILGFASDKDVDTILDHFPAEGYYLLTRPHSQRALPTSQLLECATAHGLRGEAVESVEQALQRAREMASESDMIFIGGSNFVVAEIKELFTK